MKQYTLLAALIAALSLADNAAADDVPTVSVPVWYVHYTIVYPETGAPNQQRTKEFGTRQAAEEFAVFIDDAGNRFTQYTNVRVEYGGVQQRPIAGQLLERHQQLQQNLKQLPRQNRLRTPRRTLKLRQRGTNPR